MSEDIINGLRAARDALIDAVDQIECAEDEIERLRAESAVEKVRRLRWAKPSGQLADALGVTPQRAALFEQIVNRCINGGGGIRDCLNAVEAIDDLTLEELVAAAFALGVFDGGRS
jgi:hypothetical protein